VARPHVDRRRAGVIIAALLNVMRIGIANEGLEFQADIRKVDGMTGGQD
jgi:hypothetical protein